MSTRPSRSFTNIGVADPILKRFPIPKDGGTYEDSCWVSGVLRVVDTGIPNQFSRDQIHNYRTNGENMFQAKDEK